MRVQPTQIEKLNGQHPGLLLDVDTLLNRGPLPGHVGLLSEIQAMVAAKYGVKVSHQTLSKYKQKRWLPSVQRIQNRVERSQAIIQVIRREGDSDFARAYIFEQLDEAATRGDHVDPAVLLREQRLRMELQLRFQQLAQTNWRLERGIAAAAARCDEVTRNAARDSSDTSRVNQMNAIREVYGLPPLDARTTEPVRPFDAQEALRTISELIGVGVPIEERVEAEASSDV
jgi:hypothetical protein